MADIMDDLEGKKDDEEPKGDEPKGKKSGILGKIDSSKHKSLIQIGIGLGALVIAYMTYKAMKNAQSTAATTAATTTTPSTTSTDTTGDSGYGSNGSGGGGWWDNQTPVSTLTSTATTTPTAETTPPDLTPTTSTVFGLGLPGSVAAGSGISTSAQGSSIVGTDLTKLTDTVEQEAIAASGYVPSPNNPGWTQSTLPGTQFWLAQDPSGNVVSILTNGQTAPVVNKAGTQENVSTLTPAPAVTTHSGGVQS
jgi:hypothetical protein